MYVFLRVWVSPGPGGHTLGINTAKHGRKGRCSVPKTLFQKNENKKPINQCSGYIALRSI